jgi:hypothetical protein
VTVRHTGDRLTRRSPVGTLAPHAAKRRGSDQAITGLIDRLRKLVAERRRLEGRTSGERLEARRREIDRLQRQLATVVRRELTR